MAAWTAQEKHKILRDAYRNYFTFKAFVSQTGKDVIDYAVETETGSGEYEDISISFVDMKLALERVKLSERKKEAFVYNVLCDMKQQDVAHIMGITTVTVGQYVDSAMIQLAKWYFAEPEVRSTVESDTYFSIEART